MTPDPVVVDLVAAALAPPGPARTAAVHAALARAEPGRLAFGGWRALLLLDDALDSALDAGPDPVWARRTASLRRRSFAAAAVAGRRASVLSDALARARIDHVITGELALAQHYPRPGDRPVHGLTVVTTSPRRRVAPVLASAGVRAARFGRRSLRADLGGLTLLVHHGWPGAPGEPVTPGPSPSCPSPSCPSPSCPSSARSSAPNLPDLPDLPFAGPDAEARRILRPPVDPDAPADRIDLAALAGGLPGPPRTL